MQVAFTETERVLLRQAQYACWGKAGYVSGPVLLMLDHGRPAAAIAQELGLGESTGYHYAQTCQRQGLAVLLAKEAPGYAGRLTSSQLTEAFFDRLDGFWPDVASQIKPPLLHHQIANHFVISIISFTYYIWHLITVKK